MIIKPERKFGGEMQKHIAACIIRLPKVLARLVGIIDPELFTLDYLAEIVERAIEVHKQGGGMPSRAVLIDACGDTDLIDELLEEDVRDHEYIVREVVDWLRDKALIGAIKDGAIQLRQGESTGVLEMVRAADNLGRALKGSRSYFLRDMDSRIRRYLNPDLRRLIPTGIVHLDQCMLGGLGPGEVGVIMAPTKKGKSHVLVSFGSNMIGALHGLNVVYFSWELHDTKVLERFDNRFAGTVSKHKYDDPRRFTTALKARAKLLVRGEAVVQWWPTRSAGATDMRAVLSEIIACGFKPDVVFADYVDIMKPERRLDEQRRGQEAANMEDLRELAGEFDLPVWTATQANRKSLSKDVVTIEDVAESFEKVQIADAILALCQTKDEKSVNEARIYMTALRDVQDGKFIRCSVDHSRSLWRSLEIIQPSKSRRKKKGDKAEIQKRVMNKAKRISRSRKDGDDAA